jgi:hypothetical protein
MNISVVVGGHVADERGRGEEREKGSKIGSMMMIMRICWAGRSVLNCGPATINTWL